MTRRPAVEIAKLARLLDAQPADLDYLAKVPAGDLRTLREQIEDMLFTSHGPALSRIATASKVLPAGAVAMIGERAFGPLLCAQLAGMLEPSRAVDIASRMPAPFLAQLVVHLDPRRAGHLISRISPRQVAEVASELAAREEYMTVAECADYLDDGATEAALDVIDDEALVQIALLIDEQATLARFAQAVPAPRRDRLLARAAGDPEALELLAALG